MHSSFDASLPEARDGLGFLSRLGITVAIVSVGIGLAIWMAAAG